ncbi:HD-GYP domain-containing protein [Gordoniibacillus kamchatkensis]|uniref:HD-GYP domain-containing protein n=1 Tax=Gordoniibacillus kamchatkensis TaxID=1590651 RepID=UPI000697A344|nr:HD-GYP domain-containing protein [Paenibacillus sp. VKM B-2647]
MSEVNRLKEQIRHLEQRNIELTLLLESALELQSDTGSGKLPFTMTAIQTLIVALDSRDPYTAGHSSRVALYSLWIARQLGVPEVQCRQFHHAALMHDIGKIGVPDRVLLKADSLDDEEFSVMISHTTIGARILSKMEAEGEHVSASLVAKHHHEKMDGSGYPDGLKGEAIPFFARITAVADAFDAMTTDRPYAKGRSYYDGVQELLRCQDTHFDRQAVQAFAAVMAERNYLRSRSVLEYKDAT